MMQIVTDESLLRKVCSPVAESEDVSQVAEDMSVMMYVENGIGLAAPQIGLTKRIIVMDPLGEGTKMSLIVMINPEITKRSVLTEETTEGCLSLPGKSVNIQRAMSVWVKYRSLAGEAMHVHLTGLAARVAQHEIDHLDGVLMTDFGVR